MPIPTLDSETIRNFLIAAPIILFSLVAHEYAHGYAALRQGDPTAYQLGRLTWNPVKHIDPIMTIVVPLVVFFSSGGQFIFGGAKPIPVNPRNFRRFKRGDIIVSLAGVTVNFVLAFACTALFALVGLIGRGMPEDAMAIAAVLQRMMVWGVLMNLILTFFNLIPIPPLDGSHVLWNVLGLSWESYFKAMQFGFILVIVALQIPATRQFLNTTVFTTTRWLGQIYGI